MTTTEETLAAAGAMVLRLALGTMWIAHALLKWFVFTLPGFALWLESQGLPGFMAWPIFILELIGGVLILAGFYGRYLSIILIPILFIASWVHFGNGWAHTSPAGGWEYPVFLIFTSIAYAFIGEGRFALRTKLNGHTTDIME